LPKIDLSRLKVTDLRCFAFPREPKLTRMKLAEIFSPDGPTGSSVRSERTEPFENQTSYTQFLRLLSKFLGCAPTTNALLRARSERARKNFGSYVASLFKVSDIQGSGRKIQH
jgi:hypothetical protein